MSPRDEQLLEAEPEDRTARVLRFDVPELAPADWEASARCRSSERDLFFPGEGGSSPAAKKICARCEVRHPCLEMALAVGWLAGIWGGTNQRERDKIRTRRRSAPPDSAS